MRPADDQRETQPLVELASDEAVLRALAQSAHPVEFIESNQRKPDTSEPRER